MHLIRQKLSVVLEEFYSTSHFFGFKNAKINVFEEKRDFSEAFIELNYG